jgi:hypothetical protein
LPGGQSLVEFTVMLPVLLIMLSGLVEYGILLNYYLDIIDGPGMRPASRRMATPSNWRMSSSHSSRKRPSIPS